jgi:hypothetical protein
LAGPDRNMTKPLDDENTEKPLDPAVERVRRRLVRFIGINLGILFIALMAVVAALVYRMNVSAPAAPESAGSAVPTGERPLEGHIPLPAGARLVSHAVSGNRVTLHVEFVDGRQAIFLYDMAEQRVIGRFDIGTQP